MDDPAQARAYAAADFSEPHERFLSLLRERFPPDVFRGRIVDLGCGPGDIMVRFGRAFAACTVDGVDGSEAMVELARVAIEQAGLRARLRVHLGRLPDFRAPRVDYDGVISNSLLHHLADPGSLWTSVRRVARGGAFVFVVDLLRPQSLAATDRLVELHGSDLTPEVRCDFRASLLAAYGSEEIREQLAASGLAHLHVQAVSDRHVMVSGYL